MLQDITDAVEHFNYCIQQAAQSATPEYKFSSAPIDYLVIKVRCNKSRCYKSKNLRQKTILKAITSINRSFELKRKLIKITKTVNCYKNQEINEYLRNLSPAKITEYSLWKATKKLKSQSLKNLHLRLKRMTSRPGAIRRKSKHFLNT